MATQNAYLDILLQSLHSKLLVMREIEKLTIEQEELLKATELDMERFEEVLQNKGDNLERVEDLDDGFQSTYQKVEPELKKNKEAYRSQLLRLQQSIQEITDIGIRIQATEYRNKEKLEQYLTGAKQKIKQFKVSNRTAASYYKNMANQHQDGQSYFLNQKQ